jgi:hypothetical protein
MYRADSGKSERLFVRIILNRLITDHSLAQSRVSLGIRTEPRVGATKNYAIALPQIPTSLDRYRYILGHNASRHQKENS